MDARVAAGEMNSATRQGVNETSKERGKWGGAICLPGFSNTVGPPNEPSNILIGVNTNRGPISTSDVCGGPDGFSGSFSTIWKLRNQILLSSREKVRMWSMNGFSFRDVFGTEKVCGELAWSV
jgi:hypothetical protein